MTRPAHLPDYKKPPLNEVVLDVQFSPIPGYKLIHSGEIWSLFRERFSEIQEHPPIPPAFETFGPQEPSRPGLEFVHGPIHPRFWFVEPGETELIQFQPDRLIHNWRNLGKGAGKYPHYEHIASEFDEELRQLDSYFYSKFSQKLNFNQCEIGYINHIEFDEDWSTDSPKEIFRLLHFEERDQVTDFSLSFRRVIKSENGEPYARLVVDIRKAVAGQSKPTFLAHIRVRGLPERATIPGVLEFMAKGRELIVNTFTDITTKKAHKRWERIN